MKFLFPSLFILDQLLGGPPGCRYADCILRPSVRPSVCPVLSRNSGMQD